MWDKVYWAAPGLHGISKWLGWCGGGEKKDVCWDESDAELFTSPLTVELCGLNLNNTRSSAAA